jgi:tRNA-2-methylthio-N6-dimethylallyladenosine synthase
MPQVDEFLPIEEIGFDHKPLRKDKKLALVPISNGCNNFCTYCVVPFSRGREISRPYKEILEECQKLVQDGYKEIMLLGMNVNSYGADLVINQKSEYRMMKQNINNKLSISKKNNPLENLNLKNWDLFRFSDLKIRDYKNPVFVKHLGRLRIPTLFPNLLEDICKIQDLKKISFMSSNPWDFSDELISVIKLNPNISRNIHLPVQSGSNSVLKRMNRWYTREEYLALIENCKLKIGNCNISTDIIVGFCGETDEEFQDTVDLAKKAGFSKAYVAIYSDRPMTTAHKTFKDDIPYPVKKKRWKILEEMINKQNFKIKSKI